MWTPLSVPLTGFQRTDGRRVDQDSDNTGAVIARLASGVTIGTAAEELNRIAEQMRAELPEYAVADMGLVVRGLRSDATEHARGLLTVLLECAWKSDKPTASVIPSTTSVPPNSDRSDRPVPLRPDPYSTRRKVSEPPTAGAETPSDVVTVRVRRVSVFPSTVNSAVDWPPTKPGLFAMIGRNVTVEPLTS